MGSLTATARHSRFCTRLVGLWSRPRTEMASRSPQAAEFAANILPIIRMITSSTESGALSIELCG
jgi:hypothetical protein